jgi:hypothetical protein
VVASSPLAAQIRLVTIPGGTGNGSIGRSAFAAFMNSVQTGSATRAPVILLPRVRRSSNPTQTPHAMRGVNPTNQASV